MGRLGIFSFDATLSQVDRKHTYAWVGPTFGLDQQGVFSARILAVRSTAGSTESDLSGPASICREIALRDRDCSKPTPEAAAVRKYRTFVGCVATRSNRPEIADSTAI
jgi:hypothetical protein